MKRGLIMNSRERNLLVLLAAVVVFYLCYTFIMVPQVEKAGLLKGEIENVRAELARAEELVGKEDDLKKEEEALRTKLLDQYAGFFVDLNQADLLNKMDSLMTAAGFNITGYAPSEVLVSQVIVEQGAYTPQNYPLLDLSRSINPELLESTVPEQPAGDADSEESPDRIPCLDITIAFDGTTYEAFYNFIKAVEEMNMTVNVKSMEFNTGEGGFQGQLILSLYSLPPFDDSQKGVLNFTPVIPQGKVNPVS